MLTDREQDAYNRGLVNGANIIRKEFIDMLKKDLDPEGDPHAECNVCVTVSMYIATLESTEFKVADSEHE